MMSKNEKFDRPANRRRMTFPAYVHLVRDKIQVAFPDATLAARGRVATFTRGTRSLTIDATDNRTWWVTFDRARVFDERHNVGSATVTAENAIAHFT